MHNYPILLCPSAMLCLNKYISNFKFQKLVGNAVYFDLFCKIAYCELLTVTQVQWRKLGENSSECDESNKAYLMCISCFTLRTTKAELD